MSTCVGEEGLDIGEVDLIVCFDAQKNPTRLVQRMGRTGRKRQGRIVIILAEGREERVSVFWQLASTKAEKVTLALHFLNGKLLFPSDLQPEPE